jgi:hypothetical protein
MSRSAAELLADLIDPKALHGEPPANRAKAAKSRASIDSAADSGGCEGLRISAKPALSVIAASPDSQVFAGDSQTVNHAESEAQCGFSQDSQLSQGVAPGCASADHHVARLARLIRWGWPQPEAERVAARLARPDGEAGDDRRMCVACQHYRPHRCANHRHAGLVTAEVSRALATLPQRCPGFERPAAIPFAAERDGP